MNTEIFKETLRVIADMIENSEMFTAFDITRLVKSKGHVVTHAELRPLIHDVMTEIGNLVYYKRHSAVEIKPGVRAELYAPTGFTLFNPAYINKYDADKHKPCAHYTGPNANRWTTTTHDGNKPNVMPVPQKPISQSFDGTDGKTDSVVATKMQSTVKAKPKAKISSGSGVMRAKRSLDSRGRLCVPNEFVRLIAKHGENLFVSRRAHGLPGLVLKKTAPKTTSALSNYVVDKSDNVRLSRWLLGKGGCQSDTSFKLRTSDGGDAIIVVPA